MSEPADVVDFIFLVQAEAMSIHVSWPLDQMNDAAVRTEIRQRTRTMRERAAQYDQIAAILGFIAIDPESFRVIFDLARRSPASLRRLAQEVNEDTK